MEQQVDVCDGTDDLRVSTRFTWASVPEDSSLGSSGGSLLSQAENAAEEQLGKNDHQVLQLGWSHVSMVNECSLCGCSVSYL